jgi:biotin carboxyl carrier protein
MKQFKFNIRGTQYNVHIKSVSGNDVELEVNGTPYQVNVEREAKMVSKTPTLVRSKLPDAVANKPMTAESLKQVKAPLPGNIFKLLVKEGDVVKSGDVLLIMEAMKMENNILSEFGGTVKNLKIKEGQTVLQNDVLLELA